MFPDNNNLSAAYKDENAEITRDEYGRVVLSTAFFYDGGEYSGEGFTTYENAEGSHGAYRIIRNYVIDEYGSGEMVGEPIYEGIQ